MSYENKHVYRDGKITLYTRNGSPTYHARIKVDGVKGYIVKSTKRKSPEEAFAFAEDLYDDMRYRVRHGLEVRPHDFGSMWKKWYAANQHSLSIHRQRYLVGTSDRYFLPYFGEVSMEDINDALVERYWIWRINYWSSEEGQAKIDNAQKSRTTKKRPYKQKLGNIARVPSAKTLQMEKSALGQILSWGYRNGFIHRVPEIRTPKIKSHTSGVSRRPAFDLREWRKLYQFMRSWVEEGAESDLEKSAAEMLDKDGNRLHIRRVHSLHRWQRQMLRHYVLFMGMSGLRPGEARLLRWKDIEPIQDSNGVEQIVLHISPLAKTGSRECVPLHYTKTILGRIRELSFHTDSNDFVFCDQDGDEVTSYGKTFKSLLKKADLLKDRFGKVRTIYSLRHTYATFRLIYGKANIENLAQNMGTSPKMIYDHYRHVNIRNIAARMGGNLNEDMSRKGLFF
jgi:integrase